MIQKRFFFQIQKIRKTFSFEKMNIGYKKLQNDYIAELEILGKTNEHRKNIANPQYAKYRTSKVKVLKIFKNERRGIKQMNGLYNKNFSYTVGKEICIDDYNENVNKVCSRGIHYFKTPFQAKMWGLPLSKDKAGKWNYTGKWFEWYENGNKMCEGEYKDGKQEGKWIGWYKDGTKSYEEEFKDGTKMEKKCEGEYKNENLITHL